MVSLSGRKLLIVEDDSDVRDALKEEAETRGAFVFVAESGETAWGLLEAHMVDAIIVDLMIPGIQGVDLIPKAASHGAAIVAITGIPEFNATQIYERGAHVLIRKPFSMADVIEAVVRHLTPAAASAPLEVLSDREFEVLSLIRQGHESSQISAILGISPHTVAFHRKSIRRKHRQLSFIEICALYFR